MSGTLVQRLWVYQAERFPLKKTVPLLAVFSAASVNISAVLAGRALPGPGVYVLAFILAMILFFQMRVADEVKDSADDARFRPERPIPRGLVSLRLIVGLGLFCVPLAVAAAWAGQVLWLLALVWLWLAVMSAEFGVPAWLKARPLLYLLSHMLIMPLIDLMLTGLEWRPAGAPAVTLWLFLALSFVNGCVLELGRKIWAPESEREGVETYSRLWGAKRAALIWLGLVGLAFALLLGAGVATGFVAVFAVIGALMLSLCVFVALRFAADPTVTAEKRVDLMAGLWVLVCYGTAGFAPVIPGAI